eukprot:scaffold390295_cov24-Prasinocladus_malaysianus.AAC.1
MSRTRSSPMKSNRSLNFLYNNHEYDPGPGRSANHSREPSADYAGHEAQPGAPKCRCAIQ